MKPAIIGLIPEIFSMSKSLEGSKRSSIFFRTYQDDPQNRVAGFFLEFKLEADKVTLGYVGSKIVSKNYHSKIIPRVRNTEPIVSVRMIQAERKKWLSAMKQFITLQELFLESWQDQFKKELGLSNVTDYNFIVLKLNKEYSFNSFVCLHRKDRRPPHRRGIHLNCRVQGSNISSVRYNIIPQDLALGSDTRVAAFRMLRQYHGAIEKLNAYLTRNPIQITP